MRNLKIIFLCSACRCMVEWVRALDWRPGGHGRVQILLRRLRFRNFGNSVYLAFPVPFGGDTKSRRSLPYLVPKRSHCKCVRKLSWTPHSSLEKDNYLNHSCTGAHFFSTWQQFRKKLPLKCLSFTLSNALPASRKHSKTLPLSLLYKSMIAFRT